MTNQSMKRGSTLLAIKDMRIKTAMSYQAMPTRMAKIKILTMPSADRHAEQPDFLSLQMRMQKGSATLEDSLAGS